MNEKEETKEESRSEGTDREIANMDADDFLMLLMESRIL